MSDDWLAARHQRADQRADLIDDKNFPALVSSFFGGQARGQCVQIMVRDSRQYAHLTRAEVVRLVEALSGWLKEGP
jgi:hypothetical protein